MCSCNIKLKKMCFCFKKNNSAFASHKNIYMRLFFVIFRVLHFLFAAKNTEKK